MKDRNVPIILKYAKRVILWGCRLEGDTLFVGIAFFNRGIKASSVVLSDIKDVPQGIRVEIPEQFLRCKHRARSQNLNLKIVSID